MAAIDALLTNKTSAQKADIKSDEIVKIVSTGEFTKDTIKVEIVDIKKIEKGIEVFARAWKDGKQIGFGDGSVDIERFRIFNPPILVEDSLGGVIRESYDPLTGNTRFFRYREDLPEALRQTLLHTISIVGKEGSVIKGKIGNTTSTFLPNAGTSTAPVDGQISRQGVDESFSTIRGATGAGDDPSWMTDTESSDGLLFASTTTNQFQRLDRFAYGFDIDIGTDSVDSATISFFGTAKDSGLGGALVLEVTSFTPTNNDTTTDFVNADYEVAKYGSTKFTSGTAYADWSTVAYNDLTLNASGIAYIANGIKYFATRSEWDVDNSFTGTWGSGEFIRMRSRMADQTGTTNDPKLVVEHSAAVSGAVSPVPTLLTLGVG